MDTGKEKQKTKWHTDLPAQQKIAISGYLPVGKLAEVYFRFKIFWKCSSSLWKCRWMVWWKLAIKGWSVSLADNV